ncbi:GNAT family N-acetyltransferase [Streptococcus sp. CSL10205-OR2]|uniref:GNAT family N-acetyltransferase n=1 Tax=Streptococcus sp. CSL10205-OR2 TaxID=2980558 RepID=UPI0021D84C39|nr:GNAT family N-acetyltransferase [Streptococcus sp. CSL10205-OR2]MCU9532994.1 GNAT family N-acetyltransferase [Streptococcus sp. CSL10205-OR2]
MPKVEIDFSLAQTTDAQALITFLNRVGKQTDYMTLDETGIQMSLSEMTHFIEDSLATQNKLCLLAKTHQGIIGLVNISNDSRDRVSHIGEVFIVVDENYQGYGLGHLLMEEAIDWAEHHSQLKRLELTVQKRNVVAIHLYQKYGFIIEGTKQRGAKTKNGEFLDVYLMGKLID